RLRDQREFVRLCDLAELVCRFRSEDAKAHRLYAQGLIETGRLTAAISFLNGGKLRFGSQASQYDEFEGSRPRLQATLYVYGGFRWDTWNPIHQGDCGRVPRPVRLGPRA